MEWEKFSVEKLKQDFNLTDAAIDASGFSPEKLEAIYDDYLSKRDALEQCKNAFVSRYLLQAKGVHFHSYGARIKDPYHLIEKIIRKRQSKFGKYASMGVDDYHKYITDLVGCRVLLVYKEDWRPIHDYLMTTIPHDEANYINDLDYAGSYLPIGTPPYMAEQPVVHLRLGDDDSLYRDVPGVKLENDKYYRSVHYIIRYGEFYVELQVRSISEEAWGEVDHDVLYPYFKDDHFLSDFSQIMNRLSGVSDELGSYFRKFAEWRHEVLEKGHELPVNELRDTPVLPASVVSKGGVSGAVQTITPQPPVNPDKPTRSTASAELHTLIRDE